jgi:hypothetical protein
MGRACSTYGREEECIQGLVRRPKGERPLEKPRRRRKNNINMDLKEIRRSGMDCIHLAQDRPVANSCEHGNEPSGSIILVYWYILE